MSPTFVKTLFAISVAAAISACTGTDGGSTPEEETPVAETPTEETQPTAAPTEAPVVVPPVTPTPVTPIAMTPAPTETPTVDISPWQLKWSDEFDVDGAPDDSSWSHEVNCFGGGNNEQQCYTDRLDNAFVEDGLLYLVAKEEEFSGQNYFDDDPRYDPNDTSITRPYTSGRIRSKNKFDFKYGRIEFRARLAGGQGAWPAFWMLSTDEVYGGWPRSGEIDVMEAVNLDTGSALNQIHGTLHYGLPWPQWTVNDAQYLNENVDFTGEFHVYALEWEADEIRWYIDGKHYQTQNSEGWFNYIWQGQEDSFQVANPRAPFDQEFHIIMNLAIGGDFPGAPDTGWTEDRQVIVDYVRVYECGVGNEDGTGCEGAADPTNPGAELVTDAGAPTENVTSLFADAPATLSLPLNDGTVNNTLQLNVFQSENVTIDVPDLGGDRGGVIDLSFNGPGNISLASQDNSAIEGIDTGFNLFGGAGWTQNGVLAFDLLIEDIDPSTELYIKMDSGYPNLGEVKIDLPEAGEWTRVQVRISELLANPNAGGAGLNVNSVLTLFVLEPKGETISANIQIDNIDLSCSVNSQAKPWQQDQVCFISPAIDQSAPEGQAEIFVDEFTFWNLGVFVADGSDSVAIDVLADPDPSRGDVIKFTYTTDMAVTFISSTAPLDFSAYAGGTLEFDLFVESEPDNAIWIMKTDSNPNAGTGDTPVTESIEGVAPTVGQWQHYTFNLDDLVAREGSALNLSSLQTPLVIFPAWGNQNGAVFYVDNIVMTQAQ